MKEPFEPLPLPARRLVLILAAAIVSATACMPQGRAESTRPNVLIVVADDLGFSDLGCYGSEIATPVLDSLASQGVMFSNFHTAATCSPTRAMLMTGVDHHRAGMGNMYEFLSSAPEQLDQPGYEGCLNESVMTIAEVLKEAGYHTAIAGKWHLGRRLVADQAPVGRGFDQSWILWSGWAENYQPPVTRGFVEGNRLVEYPRGRYSTEWYTDKAIEFADEAIARKKPFLLVASYTAPHWPLEAPPDFLAKQKGRYDDGYDELHKRRMDGLVRKSIFPRQIACVPTPVRHPQLHHSFPFDETRSWKSLSVEQREYSARLMEVHAAMIEALDQQIGRLLNHLRDRQQFENTLIVFLSDNGASALWTPPTALGNHLANVGRPGSFVAYGPEWARASTGPLRLLKGYSTEGGTRVPAIIKLPGGERHRLTAEFASVLDIAPTIYELTGASYPKAFRGRDLQPLNGTSLIPYLTDKSDQIHGHDYAMGWELFGRTAFRRGPWKITWIEKPFGPSDFELFHIDSDPGETQDLREQHPDVYRQMLDGFEHYARTNGVIIVRPGFWLE
jgi:arylsulfatase